MADTPPENAAYEWAVIRPDGLVFRTNEGEARDYAAAGNADGNRRYRLVRRPVAPWEEVDA